MSSSGWLAGHGLPTINFKLNRHGDVPAVIIIRVRLGVPPGRAPRLPVNWSRATQIMIIRVMIARRHGGMRPGLLAT